MSNKLSYADAVKLLGGTDSRVVTALDKLTGGLLLAVTAGGGQFVLSLFEAKAELAKLSGELVSSLRDRLRGLGRFDRTERLEAAHRVLVLTGFFESLSGVILPFDAGKLARGRPVQVAIGTGEVVPSERLRVLAGILNDSDIPGDTRWPGEGKGPDALREFYISLGGRLIFYVEGLEIWDRLDHASRESFVRTLLDEVPTAAVRRYEEHLRRLAGEFPEVAFWASRLDNAAIRDRLGRLDTSLEGLERVLVRVASGEPPDERRQALARRSRKSLERPIIAPGDIPGGLTIPALADAYVNPRYRVASVSRSARLDQEYWWNGRPILDDLQEFLIGHLTSLRATESPLIVLGQPGSGKSVLTKVIAARLPASDYLAVRVELREVPADTDLQSQVEYAIRDATGDSLTWPALARSAGGALPVVLLDGFDELLQATGIGQTDYLEQVARFQERESDQGRPVAVIVTSRIAVADRARIPPGGAVAVKLEPFTDDQVGRWLAVWNAHNAAYLKGRGLKPLPPAAALRQRALSAQPLLLLMLALYDADGNALQRPGEGLDEADLYERILMRFAEREIRKTRPGIEGEPLRAAIEEELLRLSVAAFAMFNRGRQWATEDELSGDLTALLGTSDTHQPATGFSAPSTPAQMVIGRFFFIHQAQAVRNDTRLTTCEFLHATFGEFLAARLIVRELADLAAVITARSRNSVNDSFLRALLSFVPLTTRLTIVEFLGALTQQLADSRRRLLRELLLAAFHGSLQPWQDRTHETYGPGHSSAPARHAAYSANMLLLAILIGGPAAGREIFPGAPYPAASWRRLAMLWRSQFSSDGWQSLAASLSVQRIWHAGDREIIIAAGPWDPPEIDAFWTSIIPPHDPIRKGRGWDHFRVETLRKESYFTCDEAEDIIWHGLAPVVHEMDTYDLKHNDDTEATTGFGVLSEERAISVTHAMTKLWLTSSRPTGADDLQQAYEDCLTVIEGSRPEEDTVSRNAYLARVLRQLAADHERLSHEFRVKVQNLLQASILKEDYLTDHPILRSWAAQAFTDLGYAPPPPERLAARTGDTSE